jgi:dTDP-glucose 4,6-dehydratase/UDP-glucuronate decarboxylase
MKPNLDVIREDIIKISTNFGKEWNNIEGSSFIVSGSNGLIGSYIIDTIKYLNDHYFASPVTVTCINRTLPNSRSRNFNLFESRDKNFKFISHNLRYDFSERHHAEYVIHAAGDSSPYKFQKNRIETIETNTIGTKNLLNVAKLNKSRKFIYFSSGAIYGDPTEENLPIPETFRGSVSTQDPRACYAESKRLGETLCNVYDEDFDVPTLIARIFVVYGPGMKLNDNKVITDFIRSSIIDKQIQLKSDGGELRSDTYISDAVSGIWSMILSPLRNEVFNIGSSFPPYTILSLANTIHKALDIETQPIVSSSKKELYLSTAPKNFFADVEKIRLLLNHANLVSIEQGIERTIAWFLNEGLHAR